MLKHVFLLSCIFITACSSSTQQTASAPAASSASGGAATSAETVAATDDGDDVICKRVQVTGTRFKEKVCTTRAQREATQNGAGSAVGDWQRRSAQAGGPLNGGL